MASSSQYANSTGYGLGAQAVALAARYLGVPYVWGGESAAGFDCSGLVQFVYSKLGVKLPRTSEEQAKIGITVPYANAQPGDLLLYSYGSTDDHVGIYAGNGQMIEAPHTGESVKYAAVDTAHLTSVVRPFTGGATGTADATPAASITGLPDLGGAVSSLESGITRTVTIGAFVAAGVGLVVVGLWRGVASNSS